MGDPLEAGGLDEHVGVGGIVQVGEDLLQRAAHQRALALLAVDGLAVELAGAEVLDDALDVEVVDYQLVTVGDLEAGDDEVAAQALRQAGRQVPALAWWETVKP